MLKYKGIDVDMSLWTSVNIRKSVGSQEDYAWADV